MFSKCLNQSRCSMIVNLQTLSVPHLYALSTHCSHTTKGFSPQAPVTLPASFLWPQKRDQSLLGVGWKCQGINAPRCSPFNQWSTGVARLKLLLSCPPSETNWSLFYIFSEKSPVDCDSVVSSGTFSLKCPVLASFPSQPHFCMPYQWSPPK